MDSSNSKKMCPDTVIKLFENPYSSESEQRANQLKELLQFITNTKNHVNVLKLGECIRGDIYDITYPYIMIRKVDEIEKTLQNNKDDGDPMSDYFFTLWSIKSVVPEKLDCHTFKNGSDRVKSNMNKRCIVLAFKVLDDDRTTKLDQTWKDWTGTRELLSALSPAYDITEVSCFKGVNVIPDVFKYLVLVQLDKTERMDKKDEEYYLPNLIQTFRINRMFGYCAIYYKYDLTDIMNDFDLTQQQ